MFKLASGDQAIVATHLECGLTGEFGVQWVPRPDGFGNEIAGITEEQMDAYSSRTVAITDRMPAAVASWTAKYGREPNQRELLYNRQAVTLASRHGKEDRAIDWDALTRRWDARIGGQLASIAPRVSRLRPPNPLRRNRRHACTTVSRRTRNHGAHQGQVGTGAADRRDPASTHPRARTGPAPTCSGSSRSPCRREPGRCWSLTRRR